MISRKLIQTLAVISIALFGALPTMTLAELEVQIKGDGERTAVNKISAVITKIDAKTREVTLKGPMGNLITLTAGPEVKRFDEFAVGDIVSATYVSSLSGELRAPTEAELAEPIVVLDAAATAAEGMAPGAAVGQAIRAVCTVEGMNRATRTVTLQDPDGDFHVIEDVDPAKMEGVALGDTIIVTYTQAFALMLEKLPAQE